MDLKTDLIYEAIKELCIRANTRLPRDVYEKLHDDCQIMQNAYLANVHKRPLCQDTGQVVVFLDLGQDVHLTGDWVEDVINSAVSDCYKEKFYRKSVVVDALERNNTGTNTPVILHTRIVKGRGVKILLGLKGGGAENMSQMKMFNPTASRDEIFEFVRKVASDAGENACPPMMLGIGIGGTVEYACLLAKKALYRGEVVKEKIENVFETRLLTTSTHIASMPVCVNVNCHSARHSACEIVDGEIIFEDNDYEILPTAADTGAREIKADEISTVALNEEILFSGTIYTARDAAHKKMLEEGAPIDLKDAIIF